MSLQLVAQHIAAQGRGPDSTLVHMSNREVAGLQALAQKHGGQLSVNPDTGLPEAGFLDSILPAVAGAGISYFSGGTIDPMMAAGIVGGITALDSKDLSKGLMAGLGAYGGAGMVGGLAGLGAAGADTAAMTAPQYQSAVGTGAGNFANAPMASLSTLGGGSALKGSLPILAGLAPAAADMMDSPDEEDTPPEQKKGYIRKYAFDPVTGQYKQVGVYEAGGDPNKDVTSEAGTAGAFGGVPEPEYQQPKGMAAGGTASDSERIYDYLMGRGPNPMQFTHTQGPQVDYDKYMPKPDVPITPTTPILEAPFDQYGNIKTTGGGNQSQEQREQREAAYNAPQDYLSINRYDPEATARLTKIENAEPGDRYAPARVMTKDSMSAAQLAALSPAERAMHMADVRRINPLRTLASDMVTEVGILPVINRMYTDFKYPGLGKPLAPGVPKAPVRDVQPGEFSLTPAAMEANAVANAEAQIRADDNSATSGGWMGGGGGNKSSDGGNAANNAANNAAAQTKANDNSATSGGWFGGGPSDARGGYLQHGQFDQRMAHGGIANLYNLGSYSDGGRLLKGPGDGVSDDIPATIGHGQPARLADGEFVIPARIVSEIGNGSTDAGARELYKMMDRIQAGRKKTVGKDQVAKNSKSVRHLPA
jgi:hypothetical protein